MGSERHWAPETHWASCIFFTLHNWEKNQNIVYIDCSSMLSACAAILLIWVPTQRAFSIPTTTTQSKETLQEGGEKATFLDCIKAVGKDEVRTWASFLQEMLNEQQAAPSSKATEDTSCLQSWTQSHVLPSHSWWQLLSQTSVAQVLPHSSIGMHVVLQKRTSCLR